MSLAISAAQLREICPRAPAHVLPALNRALEAAQCVTHLRASMFVAQLAHESGEFRYLEELADGKRYEGRADLGNVQPGDGPRFKGRGWIQLTGRRNYALAGAALKLDLVKSPELAATEQVAGQIAAWFWKSHGLNMFADVGDLTGCTRVINGGQNGADSRASYYQRALYALAGSHDAFGDVVGGSS